MDGWSASSSGKKNPGKGRDENDGAREVDTQAPVKRRKQDNSNSSNENHPRLCFFAYSLR